MAAIETPCTKVCVIHPARGLCLGCGRSLSEIAAWSGLSRDDRRRVMAELPGRLAAGPATQHVPPQVP